MFRLLTTIARGAAAEAEDALFQANAIRVLEQQLRDAASAMEQSRRDLALAMAHRQSEQRALDALEGRAAALDLAVREALAAGREDLAVATAEAIAASEDEGRDRRNSLARFDIDITRLRQRTHEGRQRLLDLRRGLETARAAEAVKRAGANGRRALVAGTGALRDAEATLARIRHEQQREDDAAAALDALERAASGQSLDERLAEAGIGPARRTTAGDILSRYRPTN